MRQSPTCLRYYNEETEMCPICCVQLMRNQASSEDASEGQFQTSEALQRRIKTLENQISKLLTEIKAVQSANQRLQNDLSQYDLSDLPRIGNNTGESGIREHEQRSDIDAVSYLFGNWQGKDNEKDPNLQQM